MPLASSNKTGRKKSKLWKALDFWILLLDYSNQDEWGMSAS